MVPTVQPTESAAGDAPFDIVAATSTASPNLKEIQSVKGKNKAITVPCDSPSPSSSSSSESDSDGECNLVTRRAANKSICPKACYRIEEDLQPFTPEPEDSLLPFTSGPEDDSRPFTPEPESYPAPCLSPIPSAAPPPPHPYLYRLPSNHL